MFEQELEDFVTFLFLIIYYVTDTEEKQKSLNI